MLRPALRIVVQEKCPEAHRVFAAFTEPATAHKKWLGDRLIRRQKTPGIWFKLDIEYVFAVDTSQAALINWKSPSTYNASAVNSPTFTANQGYTGASTKYIDTAFTPSSAPSPKYVQDSASAFAWGLSNIQSTAPIAGDVATVLNLTPRFTDDKIYGRMNQSTVYASVAMTSSIGLSAITRSTSTLTEIYKNGVFAVSGATASTGVPTGVLLFLTGAGLYWTGQVASGGFGQNISAAEQTALYDAEFAYMQGVGAA